MPNIVVVGTQWGDEGKGKVVDVITPHVNVVVRYQGGNNAGHTVVVGREKYVLHSIPSGILHPHCRCVIGCGVVVDPASLIQEMEALVQRGVTLDGSLFISKNAHLIMPYHPALDRASEAKLGSRRIGTTGKGVGPAYVDKAARVGIRMADLLDERLFREKLEINLAQKNRILREIYDAQSFNIEEILNPYLRFAGWLAPYITDTALLLHRWIESGYSVLFEGAQATMLDIDHGTYPFVTSSNPVAGAACVGAGVGPRDIQEIWGVAKAYTTRVGAGPFPTELHDETGEEIRRRGGEFGTTTGRPRRTGWMDLVALKYAARLNTLSGLVVTKLDVFSGFDRIRVATRYRSQEEATFDRFPYHQSVLHHAVGEYDELPGWREDLADCRTPSDLPVNARDYLRFISEAVDVPITLIGVGPGREQVVWGDAVPEQFAPERQAA